MTRRYYVPELPQSGGAIALPEAEAKHALRVMRVNMGDRITLFDGRGREAEAVITGVARTNCVCEARPARLVDRELPRKVQLAIALPKPDRARKMVQRLTEIGVTIVTPLLAERSQRPPNSAQLAKLRRAVIEASKQCGRNQLMEISEPISSVDFFQSSLADFRWIADTSGDASLWQPRGLAESAVFAVGPEGGFTEAEVSAAVASGFQRLRLGPRVLRVETAATVIASATSLSEPPC